MADIPLSCDWMGLSLSLEAMPHGCPPGCKWNKLEGTNVWQHRWVLYNDYGQRVFTLLFLPKSKIIRSDAALLEVENEWLYHGLGAKGCLNLMKKVAPYKVNGMSRCDLAADFVPDERQRDIIMGLAKGDYYVGGKRNGSGFWSIDKADWLPDFWRGIKIPHCQSWGHKTSQIKWKLYYKSKELKDAVQGKGWDKPYIVDLWKEYKMDVNNVWRLEVSMHDCNQLIYCGEKFCFEMLEENAPMIYKNLVADRFSIHKNEGHKDRSNDALADLFQLQDLAGAFRHRRYETLAKRNGRITLVRHLVQSLDTPEVLFDDNAREGVIAHLDELVRRDSLGKYFNAMVGKDFEEWCEDKRCEAYAGMYESDNSGESTSSQSDPAGVPNPNWESQFYEIPENSWQKHIESMPTRQEKSRMKPKKYFDDVRGYLFGEDEEK